jgi:hypothetical protein
LSLNSYDLDMLTLQGCAHPGCTHSDHSLIYLVPRCHPRASIVVARARKRDVQLSCSVCRNPFARVKARGKWARDTCSCPQLSISVRYTRGSNALVVECDHCKAALYEIPI